MWVMSTAALACGGFFCDSPDNPIEQAGEVVVFQVDPEDGPRGTTTMHVQVSYQGPSIDFAWVVPVPATPELFVSQDVLFEQLLLATEPSMPYAETQPPDEVCELYSLQIGAPGGYPPSVEVLAEARIGPYDTVLLEATASEDLVEWLQASGFPVPWDLSDSLDPYLADGHQFLALRLTAKADTDDLVPLGLRYPGTEPAIPIQLTRVAARDDMPLTTFVLGPHRAVPTNWLHTTLTELALYQQNRPFVGVLAGSADEAGGRAFTTYFSGSSSPLSDELAAPLVLEGLDELTSAVDLLEWLSASGLPNSTALQRLVVDFIPVPEGYDGVAVYAQPSFFPEVYANLPYDPAAAAAAVRERLVAPLERTRDIVAASPHLTRLDTVLSPHEMTVDPTFGFNEDIAQQVSNEHPVVRRWNCPVGDPFYQSATSIVELADGTELHLPREIVESDWEVNLDVPFSARIEQFSTTGPPDVLVDNTDFVARAVTKLNRRAARVDGKIRLRRYCATGHEPSWSLAALLARRR